MPPLDDLKSERSGMKKFNFLTSERDATHIREILRRLEEIAQLEEYEQILADRGDQVSLILNLIICHNHACRIDLEALANAPIEQFLHDLLGIARHLDGSTGELMDCFLPRHAALEPAAIQHKLIAHVSAGGPSRKSACVAISLSGDPHATALPNDLKDRGLVLCRRHNQSQQTIYWEILEEVS